MRAIAVAFGRREFVRRFAALLFALAKRRTTSSALPRSPLGRGETNARGG
jgi:hypothetical protein